MVVLFQVGQRNWLLLLQLDFTSLESLHRYDPGRDGRLSVLGSEGTQGHVFPNLEISETPVVQQHEAKDTVPSLVHFDRFTQLVERTS